MKVLVTNEAYRLIEVAARNGGLRPGATHRPDGNWWIDLSTDVAEHLNSLRISGESISDVIVRKMATKQ